MDTEVPLGSFARLIRRAGQEADELFARSVDLRGVTARQLAVLATVAELDHPSQAILCETTGIDRSTMADLVRRLAGRGWLSRYKTPNDLRAYAVEITPEGKTILHRVLPPQPRWMPR